MKRLPPCVLMLFGIGCANTEVPPTPATAVVFGQVIAPDSTAVESAGVVVMVGDSASGCPGVGPGSIGGAQTNALGVYRATAFFGAPAETVCVTVRATPPSGSPLGASAAILRRLSLRYASPIDSVRADLQLTP